MDLAKLVLEYIKTLIWPVLLIVALFSYEEKIVDLVENREIDAFGLKIGSRIEDISKNYETEIADLKASIESSGTHQNSTILLSKIDSINNNVKRELSQVRSQTIEPILTQRINGNSASFNERRGFEAILKQDVNEAIRGFSAARKAWPEYHNVAELEKILEKEKTTLNNALAWKNLKKTILQKYSWGMPRDIRTRFKKSVSL